ncbi:MAG: PAS domain-containing protein [Bacteroidales bacterium]|nr:PAS domain-containing protein [Bacteroidales bacterium]
MDRKKIVIVEKDKILKSILEMFIEQFDYELSGSFLKFSDAFEFIALNNIDILILDLNTTNHLFNLKSDLEKIEQLSIPIVFLGNKNDIEKAEKLAGNNVYSFMPKPLERDILKVNIDIAQAKHFKIIQNEYNINDTNCPAHCFVDEIGTIIDYSSDFFLIFGVDEDTIPETILLKDIFKDNFEFENFMLFSKDFETQKKSLFIHRSEIFEALIFKKENKKYKICFFKPLLEKEIVFQKDIANAKFDAIFNYSEEGVLVFNNQNRLVQFNKVAKKQYNKVIGHDLYNGLDIYRILSFIPTYEVDHLLSAVRIPSVHHISRIIQNQNNEYNIDIVVSPIASSLNGSIGGFLLTSKDRSDLQKLKREVAVLKDELKPVYESTIQRLYLTDINKKIVSFNESALKIIQKEFNHTLQKGDDIRQFVPKEVGNNQFEEAFQKSLKGEHISYKTKTTSEIGTYWNEVHYEPVINENGELNRVLIWTLDITESENNLIALDESNQRYELVAKGGNDGLWDWNLKNNDVYLSPRWKNLLGYEDDELVSEYGVRDMLTHPEDREYSQKKLRQTLESGQEIFQNEIRLLCKDHNYKWVLERGIILRDDKGKPYRMAGSITDITDQKETEVTLLELNRSLLEERAMFIRGNVGIIRAKANDLFNVTYVSENSQEITGYTPREFYEGHVPLREIIHPEDAKRHKHERDEAIRNKENFIEYSHYRLVKKDGTIIWVKDFTTIIRDEEGNVKDLLGYFIDISDSKKIEIEYENIQNMYYSLWQSLKTETFIVQDNGKIIYARNNEKFGLKHLLNNDEYIFNHFQSLYKWNSIKDKIFEEQTVIQIKETIQQKEFMLELRLIDSSKILITSDISLEL